MKIMQLLSLKYFTVAVVVFVAIAVAAGYVIAAEAQLMPNVYIYVINGCLNIVTVNGSLVPVPEGLNVTIVYNNTVVAWNLTAPVIVNGEQCMGYTVQFALNYQADYFDVYLEKAYAGRTTNETWTYQATLAVIVASFNVTDDEPPTQPANVTWVSPPSDMTPKFNWSASVDNIAVKGYYVAVSYPNGTVIVEDFTNAISWECPLELGDGWYVFQVKAVDYAGLNSSVAVLDFYVDTTPPSIRVLEPVNGSYVATLTPALEAYVCDTVGISNVTVTIDGSPVTVSLAPVNSTCTRVSGQLNVTEGEHTLVMVVEDVAGYREETAVYFVADVTAPEVTVVEPVNGSVLNASAVAFKVEVYDAVSGISTSSFQVYVDGMEVAPLNLSVAEVNGTIVFTFYLNLTEGWHNITVSVADLAGNRGLGEVRVAVDLSPPIVTPVSPQPDALLGPSTACTTIAASVYDNILVERVLVYVDGVLELSVDVGIASSNVTLDYCFNETGTHTVDVVVYDAAGWSSTVSWSFYVDLEPPTIVILQPVNGSIYPSAAVKLRAVITDNYAVNTTSIAVLVNGVPVNVSINAVNETYVEVYANLTLSDGWHSVKIMASDAAGNSAVAEALFAVDTEPPAIMVYEPVEAWYSNNIIYLYAVIADNVSYVAYVDVLVDGSSVDFNVTGLGTSTATVETVLNLTDGIHEIKIMAADAANNSNVVSLVVGVDTAPPVVEIVSPAAGEMFNQATVTVVARVYDNTSGVATIALTIDGQPVTDYTYNGTAVTATLTVSEGLHSLELKACDAAGLCSTASTAFTVDLTPPSIEPVEPEPDSIVGTSTVTVRARIADSLSGVNATTVQVMVDGQPCTPISVSLVEDTYIVEASCTVSLDEGVHTITVTANDMAGNAGLGSWSFTVDLTPPTVTVVSPVEGYDYRNATIQLTATACDNVGIESFVAFVDGVKVAEGVSINATCMAINTTVSLDMGVHTVTYMATDVAGHVSTVNVTFNVTVDTVPPTVEWVYPPNGSYIPSNIVDIRVLACDEGSGIDVAASAIYIDGKPYNVTAMEYNETCVYLGTTATLPDGLHRVVALVYDAAGNSINYSWVFTVDTTPPTITVYEPVAGWYTSNVVYLYAVIEDNTSYVAAVNVEVDGEPVNATVVGLGTAFVEIEALLNLTDGVHTVTIAATDAAGNSHITNITVGVDTVPPTVEIIEPVAGAYYNTGLVNVTAIVYDNVSGVATLVIVVDYDTVDYSYNGTVVVAHLNLTDGVHMVLVSACDVAGLCVNTTAAFTVDTIPPRISFDYNNTVLYKNVVWINGTIVEEYPSGEPPSINDSRFRLVYWDPDTGRFAFMNVTPIPAGNYSVKVTYTDAAGNIGSAVMVFTYIPARSITVTLYPGWNLVGISYEPVLKTPGKVFDELWKTTSNFIVYYYNASTATWLFWSPLAQAASTLKELHAGMAVWVYVGADKPITIELWGVPVNITYKLVPGWNMIAVGKKVAAKDFLPDVKWTYILAYDAVTKSWKYYIKGRGGTLSELEPGVGYWIYVEQ